MAITVIPVAKRLQIRFNCGLDENFDPIYRTRSWSNVNMAATDAAIHGLGVLFGELCADTLSVIRVTQEDELEDDE